MGGCRGRSSRSHTRTHTQTTQRAKIEGSHRLRNQDSDSFAKKFSGLWRGLSRIDFAEAERCFLYSFRDLNAPEKNKRVSPKVPAATKNRDRSGCIMHLAAEDGYETRDDWTVRARRHLSVGASLS